MKQQLQSELEEALRDSLEDLRLSRNESKAFRQIAQDLQDDPQSLAYLRNTAFRLADDLIEDHPKLILRWLERLDKIIDNTACPSNDHHPTPTVCFSPGHDCVQLLNQVIQNAKRAIDICVFTITDDHITETLIRRHRQGIPIRLITDDDKSLDDGSDIARMHIAGIPIRTDRTSNHMHHKFAIIDGKHLFTGSYNWTRGATRNHENLLLLHDQRIIHEYTECFDQLWREFA
ncbi:phospholipase D-like domain-containing protein [Poriferisphaera sp. WC338]|uniref:phospholipase D-like domain-containing protein n=1 Tax=Poriferisphaera sp. WC338 TaxID=3425129 RepID=UPI003D81983B